MFQTGSLERLSETVENAQRHWAARRKATAASPEVGPGLTVALAREAGTPGTTVAHETGARLGWAVYDYELVEHLAREMGLRADLLESLDERRRSWLLEFAEGWSRTALPVSEGGYVHRLIETLLSLGAHGQCVIVGRGAAQLLPAGSTLRVRLVGRLEDRIAAMAQRFHLSEKEAARRVQETDRERVRFVKDHFQKDPTEIQGYDLVLNTSRWSEAECADLIVDALRRLEMKAARHGAAAAG